MIGDESVNSVNARDIYEYLEIKTEYPLWFNRTVEKYDFVENEDFLIFKSEGLGNKPKINHLVNIDVAKELCMISDTPKGKEVRKYFIQCEKQANRPMTVEETLEHNARLIDQLHGKVIILKDKIKEDAPKVHYASTVLHSKGACSIRDWVGSLKQENGLQVGERKVINWLIAKGFLYRKQKQNGKSGQLMPYSEKFDYFTLEPVMVATSNGDKEIMSLRVTGTGQVMLGDKIVKHFNK